MTGGALDRWGFRILAMQVMADALVIAATLADREIRRHVGP